MRPGQRKWTQPCAPLPAPPFGRPSPGRSRGLSRVNLLRPPLALALVLEQQALADADGLGSDFDLAFDRHVPQRGVLTLVLILRLEIVEASRDQHVVVDGVALRVVALRSREERAAAQPRAALDEGHIKHRE